MTDLVQQLLSRSFAQGGAEAITPRTSPMFGPGVQTQPTMGSDVESATYPWAEPRQNLSSLPNPPANVKENPSASVAQIDRPVNSEFEASTALPLIGEQEVLRPSRVRSTDNERSEAPSAKLTSENSATEGRSAVGNEHSFSLRNSSSPPQRKEQDNRKHDNSLQNPLSGNPLGMEQGVSFQRYLNDLQESSHLERTGYEKSEPTLKASESRADTFLAVAPGIAPHARAVSEGVSQQTPKTPSANNPRTLLHTPTAQVPKSDLAERQAPLLAPPATKTLSARLTAKTMEKRTVERSPLDSEEKQTPVINVTIGRIEIRATPAQSMSAQKRHAPKQSAMTLDEYLNKQNGGGR